MKRSRFFLLVVLYCFLCFAMIVLQWISIQNANLKILVNIGTLLMALLALFIIFFQNKSNLQTKKLEEKVNEKVILPSKEEYLSYATEFQLTKREKEIGFLVLNGYSNAKLSEELYISEATVKKHLSHIYEKTSTTGRQDFKKSIQHYVSKQETDE